MPEPGEQRGPVEVGEVGLDCAGLLGRFERGPELLAELGGRAAAPRSTDPTAAPPLGGVRSGVLAAFDRVADRQRDDPERLLAAGRSVGERIPDALDVFAGHLDQGPVLEVGGCTPELAGGLSVSSAGQLTYCGVGFYCPCDRFTERPSVPRET